MAKSKIARMPLKVQAQAVPVKEVYRIFNNITLPEDRVLYAVCYLAGLRISEALSLVRSNFSEPEEIKHKNKVYDMVKLTSVINRKNTYHDRKDIPIIPVTPEESEMLTYIIGYVSKSNAYNPLFSITPALFRMRLLKHSFTVLATFHRRCCKHCKTDILLQRIGKEWRCDIHGILPDTEMYIKKDSEQITYRMHPHFLRHCRAEHLADMGVDVLDMMTVFGWATPKTAMHYLRRRDSTRVIKHVLDYSSQKEVPSQ